MYFITGTTTLIEINNKFVQNVSNWQPIAWKLLILSYSSVLTFLWGITWIYYISSSLRWNNFVVWLIRRWWRTWYPGEIDCAVIEWEVKARCRRRNNRRKWYWCMWISSRMKTVLWRKEVETWVFKSWIGEMKNWDWFKMFLVVVLFVVDIALRFIGTSILSIAKEIASCWASSPLSYASKPASVVCPVIVIMSHFGTCFFFSVLISVRLAEWLVSFFIVANIVIRSRYSLETTTAFIRFLLFCILNLK